VRDAVEADMFQRYGIMVKVHIVSALRRIELKMLNPAHVRRLYRQKLNLAVYGVSIRGRNRPSRSSS